MKALASFLVGILATIIGASVLSFMSGNKIAIQIGGQNNNIEQREERIKTQHPSTSPPQSAPATKPTSSPGPVEPEHSEPSPVSQSRYRNPQPQDEDEYVEDEEPKYMPPPAQYPLPVYVSRPAAQPVYQGRPATYETQA
jgi:type II secretory pathway pseudopilin PulG